MLDDAMLKPLQALLDRRIASSTQAQQALTRLEGRVLALALRGTSLVLYLVAEPGRLKVTTRYTEDPDAVLRASPLGFAALADAGGESVLGGRVEMEGDTATARLFQALLEHARPDWEDELSRLLGDVAAHRIGNLVRGVTRWGRKAARNLGQDVGDFLQEESRELPAREELAAFDQDLADLRSAVEQAEERLAQIARRMRELSG